MEQGLLAIAIGLMIFFMGLLYGISIGKKDGIIVGLKNGIQVGSIDTYALMIKSGVIKVETDVKDGYIITGVSDKSVSKEELLFHITNLYDNKENING